MAEDSSMDPELPFTRVIWLEHDKMVPGVKGGHDLVKGSGRHRSPNCYGAEECSKLFVGALGQVNIICSSKIRW